MSVLWNPWHGCRKISPGCENCYVYRGDARYGRDSSAVRKTADFYLPIARDRKGAFRIPTGELVYTCFTSDFLLKDADCWRQEAWSMIRERRGLAFLFITKRIDRFCECVPSDWGEGYENVSVCCTCENQDRADYRLPIFKSAPIKHKSIVCEPLLENIDLSPYLGQWCEQVSIGGESGECARECRHEWVIGIREQCVMAGVSFRFRQTGALFVKDGRAYRIPRRLQHTQAKRAGLDFDP